MSSEPAGFIPLSTALAEASPESLNDLLATPPEDCGQERLKKIIAALRAQRERWLRAETLKRDAPRPKAGKISPKALLEARPAEVSSEDLGF